MDTTQIELVVSMLGDLGQYSLTGFIVWAVSQFLLKIVGWGLSAYIILFVVKKLSHLIEENIKTSHEAKFPITTAMKRWRIQLGTGSPGILTEQEVLDTTAKINELIADHRAKQ